MQKPFSCHVTAYLRILGQENEKGKTSSPFHTAVRRIQLCTLLTWIGGEEEEEHPFRPNAVRR